MNLELMNSLVENNAKANDGLKTLRLILESLSDKELGNLIGEMREAINKLNDITETCSSYLF
jgi:hypothetical protein